MEKNYPGANPSAYKKILESGDIFDASKDLKDELGLCYAALGTVGGALLIANINSMESYLASSSFGGGVGLAAGLLYYNSQVRKKEYQRMLVAEQSQVEIRKNLGEPVDLYVSPNDNKEVLVCRWYGADKNSDPENVASRLSSLLEVTPKDELDAFAFGVDWTKDDKIDVDLDSGVYGKVLPGKFFANSIKSQLTFGIAEKEIDESVLLASRRECALLLEKLSCQQTLASIQKLLHHSKVPELVNQMKLMTGEERTIFKNEKLMPAINGEIILDLDSSKRSRQQKGDLPSYSTRSMKVEGTKLTSIWVNQNSGKVEPDCEVLCSIFGYPSDNDFLENFKAKLARTESVGADINGTMFSRSELLFAAKLLLDDPAFDAAHDTKKASTLFEEITKNYNSRLSKRTERYSRVFLSKPIHAIAVAGILSLFTFAPGAAGGIVEDIRQAGYQSMKDDFESEYGPIEQLPEAWEDYSTDGVNRYLQTNINNIKTSINDIFDDKPDKSNNLTIGESSVEDGLSSASIGTSFGDIDADQLKNQEQVHFNIKSLWGEPTEGYWYSEVRSKVNFENTEFGSTYPFKDVRMSIARDIDDGMYLQYNPGTIPAEGEAEFMVSSNITLNMKLGNEINLPIKQNTSVVSSQFVARDGDAPTIIPEIIKYPDGTYGAKINVDKLHKLPVESQKAYGASEYRLIYWLDSGDNVVRADREMDYGVDEISKVSTSTKKGLGLENNANDEEIYDAIKSKKYSLTPAADSKEDLISGFELSKEKKLMEFSEKTSRLGSTICNFAGANFNLATGGRSDNGLNLNIAVGYSEDGDGKITSSEAHLWNVDENGALIDATPVSYRNALEEASKTLEEEKRQEKERKEKKEHDIETTRKWFGGLAAGFASAGLLWVAGRGGSKLTRQVQKRQLLNSLYDPATSEQLERLQKLLYDKPERANEPIANENPKYGNELRSSVELLPDFSADQEYELTKSLPNKKTSKKLFSLSRLLKDLKKQDLAKKT